MPENHQNYHFKNKIHYVCLLKKKSEPWSETKLIFPVQNIQTISLHWYNKKIFLFQY